MISGKLTSVRLFISNEIQRKLQRENKTPGETVGAGLIYQIPTREFENIQIKDVTCQIIIITISMIGKKNCRNLND